MSRTYRRKKDTWNLPKYEYILVPGTFVFIEKTLDKSSDKYKREKMKYHQDKDKYFNSVPSWFVNLYCERKLRRDTKNAIRNWISRPDKDCLIPKFIRDAGHKYY